MTAKTAICINLNGYKITLDYETVNDIEKRYTIKIVNSYKLIFNESNVIDKNTFFTLPEILAMAENYFFIHSQRISKITDQLTSNPHFKSETHGY
jgi:hypothetical protein